MSWGCWWCLGGVGWCFEGVLGTFSDPGTLCPPPGYTGILDPGSDRVKPCFVKDAVENSVTLDNIKYLEQLNKQFLMKR